MSSLTTLNHLFMPINVNKQTHFGRVRGATELKGFPRPKTSDRVTDEDTSNRYIYIGIYPTGIWQLDKPLPHSLGHPPPPVVFLHPQHPKNKQLSL